MEWISVKDRLPENGTYVLAILNNNLPFITMFYEGKFGIEGLSEVTNPSHWLYLL